jgi:hypothetical protein
MEPQLITRKAIKKILKKNYFVNDNNFNKFLNSFMETVKINWLPIIIILAAIIILIQLYFNNKTRKEQFKKELEELKKLEDKSKERFDETDDFKSKPNYESEYYKMLPKVTNNPDVIAYQY